MKVGGRVRLYQLHIYSFLSQFFHLFHLEDFNSTSIAFFFLTL